MKVVVALDLPTPEGNLNLIASFSALSEEHKPHVGIKVGLSMFIKGGPDFVREVKKHPFDVILDMKLHDIPKTMADAAEGIADLGVNMFTVHASAGSGVRAVKKALTGPKFPNPPKILAVTILTSMDDSETEGIYRRTTKKQAKAMFLSALHSGADGIVCSPVELPFLDYWARKEFVMKGPVPNYVRFVPGIELAPRKDDQKRKGGLREVVEGHADFIVVGRPIYQSKNPVATLSTLLRKIDSLEKMRLAYENEALWTEVA
jgi:orotidine-5'-phosphate decarboxylase